MKKYAKEWEETGPFLFLPFFSRLALLFTCPSEQKAWNRQQLL